MSNPEKAKIDTEDENIESSDGSEYDWPEGDVRELVLALPALSISERMKLADQAIHEQPIVPTLDADDDQAIVTRLNVDDDQAATREQAIVAAELVMAAAEEAAVVTKGKAEETVRGDGSTKKKLGRPRKVAGDGAAGASGSVVGGESAKKPRRKGSSQLSNPPRGPPACNICGRYFGSWKAVFGHLRSHKNRGYVGFLPPPTFNAAEEGFGGVVAASSGGGGFGLGTGGLDVDLNVDPMEDEEGDGSGTTPKFDLNRSPPQDEEEEEREE